MPLPGEILQGLTEIARSWAGLAIIWHLYFGLVVVALLGGFHISRRMLAILLAAPLLSVSILAWISANPFNGLIFAIGAVVLAIIGARSGHARVQMGSLPFRLVGALLFAFGWVYPHFLEPDSWLVYLYAAPMGLVPCPTLSAVAGLALMARGLDSAPWSAVLAVLSLFYGFYGAVVLGVTMDWVLFSGGIFLIAQKLQLNAPNFRHRQ